jgi:cellulose synthase (UDP-forming)
MNSSGGLDYWDAILPGLLIVGIAVALLPWVDRRNPTARVIALGVCIALAWRYMLWRIFSTLPPLTDAVDFICGLIFVTVELLSMVGSTVALLFLTRTRNRSSEADANVAWMKSVKFFPKVDVLICTYNEEEAILERTIIGAQAMTYPNYRVWVCDDGRRNWLKALCEVHGVGYLTRADSEHAKAGNINAALAVLAARDNRPELVSILDADFVVQPEFLTRTVSLMREADVGVVQTPQHFFNPDPIQANLLISRVWPDEQRFFFDEIMASKDAWNAAFCCGTSSLLRFDALMQIGGFPTDSVTEDYLVSLRLRQQGFRTVYLNEALSLGPAPEGLAEYCGQRSRWCLGFMQICRGPSGPLVFGNKLPLVDRVMLLETSLHWAATHSFRVLGMIVPVLYLLFDIQAVHANVIDAIDHIFPFFLTQIVVFSWLTQSRVLPIMADLNQTLCALEILKAVYSGMVRPKGQKFKVTAKGGDRGHRFVQWPMLRIFLAMLALTMLGIANAFLLDASRPLAESATIALFWSWYNMLVLLLACYVCVEQPQRRRGERFAATEWALLNGQEFQIVDISVSGVRLLGKAPGHIGDWFDVVIDGSALRGRIARVTEEEFAVNTESTLQNRVHLVRHIFSGRYRTGVANIRPIDLVLAITRRLFA